MIYNEIMDYLMSAKQEQRKRKLMIGIQMDRLQ